MTTLRGLVGAAAYRLASSEVVLRAFRMARLRRKIIVLMYHEVADDDGGIDAWTVVRRSDLERQLDYVQTRLAVVSLAEALRMMATGVSDEPACVITWDDGYAGNRDVLLPLAASRGLPFTVFVATAAVAEQRLHWYDRLLLALQEGSSRRLDLGEDGLGRYAINVGRGAARWREKERLLRDLKRRPPAERAVLVERILDGQPARPARERALIAPLTVEALRELSRSPLVTIGAHSHCHNLLTQLPSPEMRESIRRSKELLEQWTGRRIEYFSYPNGDHSEEVRRAVREIGFTCAFTTSTRPWAAGEAPYALPRVGIGRYDSFELFKAKVSGAFHYAKR